MTRKEVYFLFRDLLGEKIVYNGEDVDKEFLVFEKMNRTYGLSGDEGMLLMYEAALQVEREERYNNIKVIGNINSFL